MWEQTFKRWERELQEEGRLLGREEGRKEGREEGRKAGEAELLLRQLERKFGPVDPRTRARIRRAGPDRLLEWGERILTAERLEQVFEG